MTEKDEENLRNDSAYIPPLQSSSLYEIKAFRHQHAACVRREVGGPARPEPQAQIGGKDLVWSNTGFCDQVRNGPTFDDALCRCSIVPITALLSTHMRNSTRVSFSFSPPCSSCSHPHVPLLSSPVPFHPLARLEKMSNPNRRERVSMKVECSAATARMLVRWYGVGTRATA